MEGVKQFESYEISQKFKLIWQLIHVGIIIIFIAEINLLLLIIGVIEKLYVVIYNLMDRTVRSEVTIFITQLFTIVFFIYISLVVYVQY